MIRSLPRAAADVPLAAVRVVRLRAGAVKFGILCAAIALVTMLSPRLTPTQAGVVALVGGVGILAGAGLLVVATRRLAAASQRAHPEFPVAQHAAGALLALLRGTGLPLLGLAFFAVWSFVYLGMWWFDPAAAFAGLGERPRYSDFFYYSVSSGLISPPGDIFAVSRGARAATLIEMLAGLALVTTYLSSFAGARSETPAAEREAPAGQ